MAEVVPTRGLLYDPARAGPLDALVAPPYDVVSETERSALAAKSPYNIVRVDLPQGDPERKYGNAARELRRWVDEGILRRDAVPALYRYHQIFSTSGQEHTRKGFIGPRPSAQVRRGRGPPARADPLGPEARPAGAGASLPHPPFPGVRALLRSKGEHRWRGWH